MAGVQATWTFAAHETTMCRANSMSGGMSELIFVVEEAPEGGFAARALGVSIFTEADTRAELPGKVRDAVRCHFEEGKAPRVVRLHHVREEVIAV